MKSESILLVTISAKSRWSRVLDFAPHQHIHFKHRPIVNTYVTKVLSLPLVPKGGGGSSMEPPY